MQGKRSKAQCPFIDPMQLGTRLKKLCARQNISVAELKEYLHLGSAQAVYLWFGGKRLPNLDNLKAISRYLGERVDDLINSERTEQVDLIMRNDLLPLYGKRVVLYWLRLQKK